MKKRLVSIALALAIFFSSMSVCAFSETEITVYLSVSRYGELVQSIDGEVMAYVPVALNGDESHNLDDVFKAAHRLYYPQGEDGYASSEGDWGLGIDMLWGDTSGNFGYQVNAGQETVMGLDHPVEDGDYIDVCIYRNLYPDTESYSRFDIQRGESVIDEEFTLALSSASGYDESWNAIYSPCSDATIFVNGNETDYTTDENGEVTLSFSEPGTYIVTAKKTKTVDDKTMPDITAPVCLMETKDPAIEIMHKIAAMYSQSDFADAGGNLPWILADMCVYEELFPDSENILTEERRYEGAALIADFVKEAEKPGDLAKGILALNALGYDATKIYTQDFEYINPVEKLIHLADSDDEAVTNIYTLPYVIISLWDADYDGMDKLINAALESKDAWQDITYGTDAVTPMILALSPYKDSNDRVNRAIEESVEIVKREQREDGLIDGFEGYEAASTGLAVCALAAAGIDPAETFCADNSLIDGLLSVANDDYNGFPNAFATEQGFRGLLAWSLMDEGRVIYDFSHISKEELNLSGVVACPVIFDVSPEKAKITIEGFGKIRDGLFDLPAGEYTYKVTCSGYKSEEESFTVSDDDELFRTPKNISVSLSQNSYGGGYFGGKDTTDKITEPEEKEETPPKQEEKKKVSEVFVDVSNDAWYNPAVQYVYEKGLLGGTGECFEPESSMTRSMLVTVLYRLEQPETTWDKASFADVKDDMWYAQSVAWAQAAGVVTGVSETEFMPDANITREQIAVVLYRYACMKGKAEDISVEASFDDASLVSDFAKDAMEYAVGMGIINGKDSNMLCPKENANRAEVATMLMRFAEVMAK